MLLTLLLALNLTHITSRLTNLDQEPLYYLSHNGSLVNEPAKVLNYKETQDFMFYSDKDFISARVYYHTVYPDDLELVLYYDDYGNEYYGITTSEYFKTSIRVYPDQHVEFKIY